MSVDPENFVETASGNAEVGTWIVQSIRMILTAVDMRKVIVTMIAAMIKLERDTILHRMWAVVVWKVVLLQQGTLIVSLFHVELEQFKTFIYSNEHCDIVRSGFTQVKVQVWWRWSVGSPKRSLFQNCILRTKRAKKQRRMKLWPPGCKLQHCM